MAAFAAPVSGKSEHAVPVQPLGVHADKAVLQRKRTQGEDGERPLPLQREDVPGQQPAPAGGPIVDDGSPLGPGQMARSTFMAQARSSLMAMCGEELAVVGRSAEGCPYIQHWLDVYDQKPAAELMRAIQLYSGAGPTGADAGALLGVVVGRVRAARCRTWVASGQISGVPAGVNPLDPSAGPPADAQPAPAGPVVQTKRESGGGTSASPVAVRSSLGRGQGLDGGVRARMEGAFGQSFGDVRVHVGATAAAWNEHVAARAFTVGTDVAFGSGEYRPGSLTGDLLIAHELAHVTQQRGGGVSAARASDRGLEMEADRAAASAMGLLPGELEQYPQPGRGLSLQRCMAAPAGALLLEGGAVAGGGTAVVAGTGWGTAFLTALGLTALRTLESDSPSSDVVMVANGAKCSPW